jgi:hypothetical protein
MWLGKGHASHAYLRKTTHMEFTRSTCAISETLTITDQPRFNVFGDESTNSEIVAYALVIVPAARMLSAESVIGEAKIAFHGAPDASIHCKNLLHGDQRKRSAWSHLNAGESFLLLEQIMRCAHQVGVRAWIGYLDRRRAPQTMLFEHKGAVESEKVTDLHLAMFAYHAAMGPVQDILPHKQMRAWMDPNRDRLKPFLGRTRKQFRLAQGFFPLHHENRRFEPERVEKVKPQFLELADVVAHCGARALSQLRPDRKEPYEKILKQIRPGLSFAHFNLAPGPVISIQAKTAAINEMRDDLREFANGEAE